LPIPPTPVNTAPAQAPTFPGPDRCRAAWRSWCAAGRGGDQCSER
jgi:hypothetical protein